MSAGWRDGGVGRVVSGPYAGRYIQVDEDQSGAGFHIWLMETHPIKGPSHTWDVWADDAAQVDEWFAGDLLTTEWS